MLRRQKAGAGEATLGMMGGGFLVIGAVVENSDVWTVRDYDMVLCIMVDFERGYCVRLVGV
jgi:hypothetical protein